MSEIHWLERLTLELLHAESLVDHGGLAGIRDEGLLEGALAWPLNQHLYEDVTDIFLLAASYGVSLANNHPFLDGNKRVAFIAMMVFAQMNGFRIVSDQVEAAAILLSVAAGEVSVGELATWLKAQFTPPAP